MHNRESEMKPAVWYVVCGLTVVGLMLALGTGYWWYYRELKVYHGYTPLPFSPEAWATASPEARGYMLKDLRSQHSLKGMTLEEVQSLLGPPDAAGDYGMNYKVGFLGFNPRAGTFPNVFHLELGDQDRVVHVYTSD